MASSWLAPFQALCLGREPKAKVATACPLRGKFEMLKGRRHQKQRKATVGTKKLISFFAPVANGDINNKDDK